MIMTNRAKSVRILNERFLSDHILKYLPGVLLERLRQTIKFSVRIDSNPADIRTRYSQIHP
jgi:hypothetical protein